MSSMQTRGKGIPGRGDSKCKGLEVKILFIFLMVSFKSSDKRGSYTTPNSLKGERERKDERDVRRLQQDLSCYFH